MMLNGVAPMPNAFHVPSQSDRRAVSGAEHPEIGRRFIREEVAVPAVRDGAVEHEHLPEAVGLRLGDEGAVETEQLAERIAPHEVDDAIVELLRCGTEAVRSLRV